MPLGKQTTLGRIKSHVCVHAVRLHDGQAMAKVIYWGTRAECNTLADWEPPAFAPPSETVADEVWWVGSAREWADIEATIDASTSERMI